MGKLLLGGFAISVGLSGIVGMGSSPSPIAPTAVMHQQKQAQRTRVNFLLQQEAAAAEAAAAEAEAAQQLLEQSAAKVNAEQ